MNCLSTIRKLIAAALVLSGSMTTAPAITVLGWNGSRYEMRYISGTLTHVDQDRHSFTLEWKGPVPTKMEYSQLSFEQTYRVTDATVYKNGSWTDMKKGVHVLVTGHSDVLDTIQFARQTAKALLEANDQNAAAFFDRGLAKEKKGDLDGAMADYNRAITLNPKYALAYNDRRETELTKGDLAGAIADFTRAIQLNPKYGLAYRDRGKAKQKKGDLDGAIADFDRSIKIGVTAY